MTSPTGWTTPADIASEIRKHWNSGRILAARLEGAPLFPLDLRLRRPDIAALSARFDEVRKWIRALEDGGKAALGHGYDIVWAEINHRQLGRNRLPASVRIETERDALGLIGKHADAERFSHLADRVAGPFPELRDWLARNPLKALDHAGDWDRILAILAWFRLHPRPGLYLRQLDIQGVDTKFIETRKGLLAELLDRVLAPEAIDARFAGFRNFEQRYGLASKPALVRFRILDPRLRLRGLSDLAIPAADFARLDLDVERIFVTENEINGLAFPAFDCAIVVFGLGYGVDLLAEAEWLRARAIHYWGDIDTHGFAILDRLRSGLPAAGSLLMNRATLLAHRNLWVREGDRFLGVLGRLTDSELSLFDDLKGDVLGDAVRLEQERIAFGWLERALTDLRQE